MTYVGGPGNCYWGLLCCKKHTAYDDTRLTPHCCKKHTASFARSTGKFPSIFKFYEFITSFAIITSLAKEVMFLVALVCLSVCLFVCLWTTLLKKLWTDWDDILWRGPGYSTMKNWLNCGGDLGILRWVNEQKKPTIIVVAYTDCGVGKWSKTFIFFFVFWGRIGWGGGSSLSPPRLNIVTLGNMGVMICLGQGDSFVFFNLHRLILIRN